MASQVVTEAEFAEYRRRVVVLREKFELLGRGTQQKASYGCQIGASRVSLILSGRSFEPDALATLEAWASEQVYPEDFALEAVAV